MRALRYFRAGLARDVLEIVEEPDPKPGPGEVRVRIRASGINPHDTKKRSGWLGSLPATGGVTPHSDGAGLIDAVGAGVPTMRLGQAVYILRAPTLRGTAAEKVVVGADWAIPLPEGLGFAEGASLGVPSFTAWLAVLSEGPVTGRTILIHGGGGCVGRVCVELAAWNGAQVIATASSDRGRATAISKGADLVLDRNRQDVAEAVLAATDGRGADRIVDVEFASNQAVSIRAIADHGTLAAYSSTSDKTPVLDYYGFALKGARIRFVQGAKITASDRDDAARTIGALLAKGRLRPDVAARFSLEEAADAHEAVEKGASGNVVIDLEDAS